MLFLPYKIDVDLSRFPIFTCLIVLICLIIFNFQKQSWEEHRALVIDYCQNSIDYSMRRIIRNVNHEGLSCPSFWASIREHDNPHELMWAMAKSASSLTFSATPKLDAQSFYQSLAEEYDYYINMVPGDLTSQLEYDPKKPDLVRMVTSSFSHASWSHVIGNLIFFYVFAAGIEIIIGSLVFLGVVLMMSISTSLAYSFSVFGIEAAPSVGLSGIVFGMIAMLAVLSPQVKIKCFLWLLVIFKIFRIPALVLARLVYRLGFLRYEVSTG